MHHQIMLTILTVTTLPLQYISHNISQKFIKNCSILIANIYFTITIMMKHVNMNGIITFISNNIKGIQTL